MKILISASTAAQQLAAALALAVAMAAFEAGTGPKPTEPAVLLGVGLDGAPAQGVLLPPDIQPAGIDDPFARPHIPTMTALLTSSEDLKELDPMLKQIQAGNLQTEAHIFDMVIGVVQS